MSERDKRALMILGGALALFGVLQLDFWLPGGSSGSVSSGAIESLEQRLQLAQVKARQRPLTEAELQAAQKQLDAREKRLLESTDAALAQAEMRSLIGDLITAEGIEMKSSRFTRVDLEGESYSKVPLTVDFSCQIEQIVNLLASIANSERLLTPRDLRIRVGNKDIKSVEVRLTVAGYLPVERTPDLIKKPSTIGAAGAMR